MTEAAPINTQFIRDRATDIVATSIISLAGDMGKVGEIQCVRTRNAIHEEVRSRFIKALDLVLIPSEIATVVQHIAQDR